MRARRGSGRSTPEKRAADQLAAAVESRHRLGVGLAAVVALLLAGCAELGLGRADQLLAAGDYQQAADAYETLLDEERQGKGDERVLYRLALTYALAEPSAGDPARAAALLSELVERFPGSPRRATAELLLRLLHDRKQREMELAEQREQATRLIERSQELQRLVNDLAQSLGASEGEVATLRHSLDALERQVHQLRAENRDRAAQIEGLRLEMELLKAIDLGGVPPALPGPSGANPLAEPAPGSAR